MASTVKKVGDAARNFACELYRLQPGALIPNPISDALHAVWDEFCGNNPAPNAPPLPPPPTSQFSGGQCCDAAYRVFYRLDRNGVIENTFDDFPTSKILELRTTVTGNTQSWGTAYQNCAGVTSFKGQFSGQKPITVTITSITRISGNSANCGNPPATFPPAPSPPSPGGYVSPPTPITFNDNSITNFNFTLKPPLALPGGFLPPIIINTISPNLSFKGDFNFNFNGEFNFSSGDGGGGEFTNADRNTLNDIKNSQNNLGDKITNVDNDVTNINNTINNITNINNNKPPNPDDFEPPTAPTLPGTRTKSYLAAVEITLTQIPKNAKIQSGEGAPNVVYAGWFEWKRNDKFTPREPIHFEKSVFLAPSGIDGYAWTLYDGFTGTAQEIVNKEKI